LRATSVAGATPAPQGFQWKWFLLTIPIVAGATLALMLLVGFSMGAAGVNTEDEQLMQFVGVIVILAGMLLGGGVAGWLSPGRTILEPGAGIAATLAALNLAMGATDGLLLSWVLPFLIGAAGAWVGESLAKRAAPKSQ